MNIELINRIEAIRDIDEGTLGSEQKHFLNTPCGILRIYFDEEVAELEFEEHRTFLMFHNEKEYDSHWESFEDVEGYSQEIMKWIEKKGIMKEIEFIYKCYEIYSK